MEKTGTEGFQLKLSLLVLIFFFAICGYFSGNAAGMSVTTETYIVIPKNNGGRLQSLAIKRAIGLSLKKAAGRLIGGKKFLNKNAEDVIKTKLYPDELKYIYSFKIIEAKKYLNLYYIKIKVYIRKSILIDGLKSSGFKIVNPAINAKSADYKVYYVKFIGNFRYSDSNKFQKLMIKHSRHLKNLYVSSFSEKFAEIKVLYYGSIIRLFKIVKPIVRTYLDARVYAGNNDVIIVDVK